MGAPTLASTDSRGTAERIGVFAVVVDAKDDVAIAFYEKHGFISLQNVERRLFLPMETARRSGIHRRPSFSSSDSPNPCRRNSSLIRRPTRSKRPLIICCVAAISSAARFDSTCRIFTPIGLA